MGERQQENSIVGRGNREGADLFRQWFANLNRTAEEGSPAAYVFVMGSINEILRTFNLPVVFPEINSLQLAVRRVAHEYLNQAEDYHQNYFNQNGDAPYCQSIIKPKVDKFRKVFHDKLKP